MPVRNTVTLDCGQRLKLGQFPGMSTNVSSERIREFGCKRLASLDAFRRESKCSSLESSATGGHYVHRLAQRRASSMRQDSFKRVGPPGAEFSALGRKDA
jgi:hypothetical protein